MNIHLWNFLITLTFGLTSAAGVWVCYWFQRVGWTITLAANLLLIAYGVWTAQYGFSIAVPLAAAAQIHHLYRSRREPWTGRRVPAARTGDRPRTKRRWFRHQVAPRYAPGRAPVAPVTTTALLTNTVEPEPRIAPLVGVKCPCGCGTFAPSDFVAHLEVNRGSMSHWALLNRG